MAINSTNRVIHRFIQEISAYEPGGEFYSQIIPLDTQAYAIYPNQEENYLFYVIGDGEHTYSEIRSGLGNGKACREYPVLTKEKSTSLIDAIKEEERARKEVDNLLQQNIDAEEAERKRFDDLLDEALGEEIENRQNAIEDVSEDLNSEIDRAIRAENNIKSDLNDEITRAINVENDLQLLISDEETRAKGVEASLQENVDTKQDRLTEAQLQAVNSGVTNRVVSQVSINQTNISNIQSVIPNAASEENQLADRLFVTSSVAKDSATFRGTFNSIEELNAYAGEKDNNDYAYVVSIDESGNQSYDEYKFNGTQWVYEFTLSGTTFTSDQWQAINSGATSNLIAQITTNKNDIQQKQDILIEGTNINIHNNVISTPSTVLNKVKNVVVQTSDFVSDIRYSGYNYRADISVTGVTANDYPNVIFSIEDCLTNNYASFVESGNGYVSIWSKEVPESPITIPVITFE